MAIKLSAEEIENFVQDAKQKVNTHSKTSNPYLLTNCFILYRILLAVTNNRFQADQIHVQNQQL